MVSMIAGRWCSDPIGYSWDSWCHRHKHSSSSWKVVFVWNGPYQRGAFYYLPMMGRVWLKGRYSYVLNFTVHFLFCTLARQVKAWLDKDEWEREILHLCLVDSVWSILLSMSKQLNALPSNACWIAFSSEKRKHSTVIIIIIIIITSQLPLLFSLPLLQSICSGNNNLNWLLSAYEAIIGLTSPSRSHYGIEECFKVFLYVNT